MPLTPAEANQFVKAFQQALAGFVATPPQAESFPTPTSQPLPSIDGLVASAERLLNLMTRIGDALIANLESLRPEEPDTSLTGESTQAPTGRKRGPKPKTAEGTAAGAGVPSAAPGVAPGAPTGNTLTAQPVNTLTPPQPIQAKAPDPLDDMPDFLKRDGTAGKAAGPDLGIGPAPAPQPAPPPQAQVVQLNLEQVKQILRDYMQRYGDQGTNKLTDLLVKHAGVKKFTEVPPEKWPAVVAAAQAEMR